MPRFYWNSCDVLRCSNSVLSVAKFAKSAFCNACFASFANCIRLLAQNRRIFSPPIFSRTCVFPWLRMISSSIRSVCGLRLVLLHICALETHLPITFFFLIKKQGRRSSFPSIRNKHNFHNNTILRFARGRKEEPLFPFFSCNNHGDSARKFKRGQVAREYISLTQFMNQPVTRLERRKSSRGNEIVAGICW